MKKLIILFLILGLPLVSFAVTQIQLRHDTAANWTSANPVLASGEKGIETDTGKEKNGNGSTAWNSLAYMGIGATIDDTKGNGDTTFVWSADKVFDQLALKAPLASPTFTGHPTVEGVTSTGATGTGKFVFDTAPTFSGTVTAGLFASSAGDGGYYTRMANTAAPTYASPSIGDFAYNIATGRFPVYNGTNWTTESLATTTGSLTNGYCVEINSSGKFVQSSGPCTTGGSMTWPSTSGIPYWTSGTAWGGAYNSTTRIPANFITDPLNQNTTGSAASLTTARTIYGNSFNGTANLTQIIASTYGGTGNGFTKFTGPTTSEKTFTLPDASATVLTDNAVVTGAQGGTGVANTGKTITLGGNLTTTGAYNTSFTQQGSYTITLPNSTSSLAILGANTFTGTQALGSNNLTMTGSIAATGARVTKGWFTDIESTNAPTVGGVSVLTKSQTFTKCSVIKGATTADDYPIEKFPYAITITGIRVYAIGGTNVVGGLDECTGTNGACSSVTAVDSDITGTAGSSVADDGSLTNGGIAANNWIQWHTTSVSGTNTSLSVCFNYTID